MQDNRKGGFGRPELSVQEVPHVLRPSAASADMLVQRFQAFASEVLMDPVHELVGRQRPIRLNDRPLAVQPARLDRVEPGALHRQPTHQDPDPAGALHRAVMRSQSTPAPLG